MVEQENLTLSPAVLLEIRNYIETHLAHDGATVTKRVKAMAVPAPMACETAVRSAPRPRELDAYLRQKDAGFVETLLELIRERDCKNSDIYKKANITKQHFSKLINTPNATITKPVAVAFAMALELDLKQTQALLKRAGYTLGESSIFDLIIRYHIENRIYNVVQINLALFEFDQSLLGS